MFAGKLMDLETIMLSKISQAFSSYMWNPDLKLHVCYVWAVDHETGKGVRRGKEEILREDEYKEKTTVCVWREAEVGMSRGREGIC